MKYEFKGTKGEWHPIEYAGFWDITDAPFYESKRILSYDSDVFGDCATETQAKANAYLCAAAPDLLQACIDIIELLPERDPYAIKMKQAIHKALNIEQ